MYISHKPTYRGSKVRFFSKTNAPLDFSRGAFVILANARHFLQGIKKLHRASSFDDLIVKIWKKPTKKPKSFFIANCALSLRYITPNQPPASVQFFYVADLGFAAYSRGKKCSKNLSPITRTRHTLGSKVGNSQNPATIANFDNNWFYNTNNPNSILTLVKNLNNL